MTRDVLQPGLSQTYQRDQWLDTLKAVLPATQLFAQPQGVPVEPKSAKAMHQLGRVRLRGGRQLAVLEIEVADSIDLVRNRVGLSSHVARIVDQAGYHGVLARFFSREPDFRFTFAARESFFDDEGQLQRRETTARRCRLPRTDNSNYLWIQLFHSALKEKDGPGFAMANSASDIGASERQVHN